MKPVVPKFPSDLSVRLSDIAEKQVPAKLKLIVVCRTEQDLRKLNGSNRFKSGLMKVLICLLGLKGAVQKGS